MTAGLLVLGIAVGLPALAWWIGDRPFWSRLRPRAEPDPWGDAMRRYRLTPAETAKVEAAVHWGRRVDEDRLRSAAVAWAQAVLEQQAAHQRRHRRPLWVRVAVAAVLVATLGAGIAWLVRQEEVPWFLVLYGVAAGVLSYWTASAPRRAIRLNSVVD